MKEKSNVIEAFSELAPRYERVVNSELNRFWGWSYTGFIDHLIASTPIQPQDIILDIATGTGVIPSILEKAGHPLSQIHGLDITFSMLKHARRRLGQQDGNVNQNLVCASAMEMPYASSSFSQVICGLATHHMDVKKLIREILLHPAKRGETHHSRCGGIQNIEIPACEVLHAGFRILLFPPVRK